ncbi:thiamine-binding protein [bacterium]|nr:thiamine-binding protein [bacterium]
MTIQAEISLYTLGARTQSPAINDLYNILNKHELEIEPGRMSSIISGDSDILFPALQEAFETAAENSQIVMTLKISNACPLPD